MHYLADRKAKEVATMLGRAGVPQKVCVDPLTILAIVSILLTAIQLLYRCTLTTDKAAARARNLTWLDRWRLRRLIRRETRKCVGLAGHEKILGQAIQALAFMAPPADFGMLWVESRQTHL